MRGAGAGAPGHGSGEQQGPVTEQDTKSSAPPSLKWSLPLSSPRMPLFLLVSLGGGHYCPHSHFTDKETEVPSCLAPNPGLLYTALCLLRHGAQLSPLLSSLPSFLASPTPFLHILTSAPTTGLCWLRPPLNAPTLSQ